MWGGFEHETREANQNFLVQIDCILVIHFNLIFLIYLLGFAIILRESPSENLITFFYYQSLFCLQELLSGEHAGFII